MAVRHGPRRRYILFRIDSQHPKQRGDLIGALNYVIRKREPDLLESARDRFHVILTHGSWGIVRCSETDRELTERLLSSVERAGRPLEDVKIETVMTSGTIKTLKKKASIPFKRKRRR